ncbi:MAG: hypothetical protein ACJAVZ_001355 [Afipia broomeae]|uniref:Uncharacterized protein n=1 Tax=Candidatus Afipia apatlaquensis TaxID=2712852 RepID=A0A7C9RJT8_9BRAD|nr:hypothetical protein [Candidatus Afipia apatlaquensis]RTL76016.1 MAG: hypothetical protein EKK35_20950 [Bradyrhizobiaceae bacterium]
MSNFINSDAIAYVIKSIYRDHVGSNEAVLNQAIVDNVFAVTMKFDSAHFDFNESKRDPANYLTKYRDWFTRLVVEACGNNMGRKRYQQPLSVSYIDFPGSKGTMSAKEAANFLNFGLLHVHAVVALRPEGQAFRRPLLVAGSAHQLRRFGEVKVEPYDPEKGSLEKMIQYCSKGAELIGPRHRSDCYELLPR